MTTEAHPTIADLAERIAKAADDYAPDFPRHGTVEFQAHLAAHLAPLYAENERLKAENANATKLIVRLCRCLPPTHALGEQAMSWVQRCGTKPNILREGELHES